MIKQLALVNFRGHNRTLEFGSKLNMLLGPNESGKSTVKEALAFVWCGTDSAGTKNPDHLISDGTEYCEVAAQTEHVTITRRKRRDATSTIKITRHGMPPVSVTQTELNAQLKLSFDTFMSCWNVGHFMGLDSAKQIPILGELAAVDRRALLESILPYAMPIPSKVKLLNPKIDADAMAGERRAAQNMKASDEGALAQVTNQLAQLNAVESVDVDSYSGRLNEINAELEQFDFYRRSLTKYQGDKARFDAAAQRKPALTIEVKDLQTELKNLVVPEPRAMEPVRVKIRAIVEQYEALDVQLKGAPAIPVKPRAGKAGATCNECGQGINAEHVNMVMGSYEKKLLEYNKESRDVETHNEQIRTKKAALNTEKVALLAQVTEAESQQRLAAERSKTLQVRINHLNAELAQIALIGEPAAPAKPAGDEAALRAEQLKISTEVNVAQRQATQLAGFKSQAEMLGEQIKKRNQQVNDFALLEKALRDLPKVETEKLLESVSIEGVQVTLEEGVLTVRSGNIPYASLSSGRKMKTDLAFCKSLRIVAGAKAPTWLFTDNADLMDKYHNLLPENLQTFVAKVDGEIPELMVVTSG